MPEITDEGEPLASDEWERDTPGPLWHWWLAGAKPDGAGLRRWQLWIWWTRQRGTNKRLSAAVRFLRGLPEAPLEAWGGVQRFGEKTKNVHGVSRTTQFRQLLMLRWQSGVRPESYYKFQLFKPERLPAAADFLEEIGQLLQVLFRHIPRTEDERLFVSKEEFRRWCLAHIIPTVENLLEVNHGRVVSRLTEQLPASDLFVKPTNWRQGKGTSRWQCMPTNHGYHYTDGAGRELTTTEFEDFVCQSSLEQGRPYIVQPALTNHEALRGYTNGALSTIRFMTVRDADKPSQPLMAALRMPTGDAIADNFDLGGVAAPIDLNTGICGKGIRKKGQLPPDTINTHPDTGAEISGLMIPYWSECLALTCRAHDLINAQVPVIGWDVAVLEHGPILIEPNHLPCHNLAQMPGGFPLGDSPFAEIVTKRLRQSFLARSSPTSSVTADDGLN